MDQMVVFSQLHPAVGFDCYATDLQQRLYYTGDVAIGDRGFIVLGGAPIIDPPDIG